MGVFVDSAAHNTMLANGEFFKLLFFLSNVVCRRVNILLPVGHDASLLIRFHWAENTNRPDHLVLDWPVSVSVGHFPIRSRSSSGPTQHTNTAAQKSLGYQSKNVNGQARARLPVQCARPHRAHAAAAYLFGGLRNLEVRSALTLLAFFYFFKLFCKNIGLFENFTLLTTIRRSPRRFQA
jgi:hypothetical protein